MRIAMLCVLLLATRERAIQLAKGDTEKYNLPPRPVKNAMLIATAAVFGQAILMFIIPFLTGELQVPSEDGDVDTSRVGTSRAVALALTTIRYVLLVSLYAGIIVIMFGCLTMEAPRDLWDGATPPAGAALQSAMILAVVFFLVYLAMAVMRGFELLPQGTTRTVLKLQGLLKTARGSVNLAPMIGILFIAARMRALQVNPADCDLQDWARPACYFCVGALSVQVAMVIIFPLIDRGCEVEQGPTQGEVIFRFSMPKLQIVGNVIHYVSLFFVYAGVCSVAASVYVIKHPEGKTRPVSPAMRCVLDLTTLYFIAYTSLCIFQTLLQFNNKTIFKNLVAIFDAGTQTVMFAPMLAILFVAARIRALQLTLTVEGESPPGAGPQPWAQAGMYLATCSLIVQFILSIAIPLVLRSTGESMDALSNPSKSSPIMKVVGIVLPAVHYTCKFSMYGGAAAVVLAIFVMKPQDLPPYAV